MIVAYLRVSTEKQHLKNQQDEIRRFAQSRGFTIDRWVTETVSGRKNERDRKLGVLLRRLRPGDTLVVTELSRLRRTLTEIMSIMGLCLRRQIVLYSTKDGYAFDDSINSKVLWFAFGRVAEIERNLISMRTKEARALRRSEGVVLGRRKGSCVDTIAAICKTFGVSRDTFHSFRRRDRGVNETFIRTREKPAIGGATDESGMPGSESGQ